jgi:hypothetical protein
MAYLENPGWENQMTFHIFFCFLAICLAFPPLTAAGQAAIQLHQAPPREIRSNLIQHTNHKLGPVIPGLQQGAVPQGITFSKKHGLIFITHYFDTHRPSAVSVTGYPGGKTFGTFALMASETSYHYGHVGGVAADDRFIWVSSQNMLYQYNIADLKNAPSGNLVPVRSFETETRASFVTYYNQNVFVGEFAYGDRYRTKASHHTTDNVGIDQYAWICGYDTHGRENIPKYILSIPQRVQGCHITDAHVILSISYGRRNRSTIAQYRNPLGNPPDKTVTLDQGAAVPLWYLDEKNRIRDIDFPPMSEGIVMIDGRLAVLSESGAEKYQTGGMGPLDYVVFIDLDEDR